MGQLGRDDLGRSAPTDHSDCEYERNRAAAETAAIAVAVAHGVKQEHEYYGTLVSGVFSNADLAANYAGMKFYMNLRQPV